MQVFVQVSNATTLCLIQHYIV